MKKKSAGASAAQDVVARCAPKQACTAVDVRNAGGTSWSEVERYRIAESWRADVAAEFAGWGIPTAQSLREARDVAPNAILFASGGIRNGLDVTKALALGANLVGLAGPFLRAANKSEDNAVGLARELIEVLRVAMFSLGAKTIPELRDALLPPSGQGTQHCHPWA